MDLLVGEISVPTKRAPFYWFTTHISHPLSPMQLSVVAWGGNTTNMASWAMNIPKRRLAHAATIEGL